MAAAAIARAHVEAIAGHGLSCAGARAEIDVSVDRVLRSLTEFVDLLHDAGAPAVNVAFLPTKPVARVGLAFVLDEWPEAVAALMRTTLPAGWTPASDPESLAELQPTDRGRIPDADLWPDLGGAALRPLRRDVLFRPAEAAGGRRWHLWSPAAAVPRGSVTTADALGLAASAIWRPARSVGDNPAVPPTPVLT